MDFDEVLNTIESAIQTDRLPTAVRSLLWKGVGAVLLVAAILVFGNQLNTESRVVNGGLGAIKMIVTVALAYSGSYFYIRGRRIHAKTQDDDRPAVLYLRSFRDDAKLAQPQTTSLPFMPSFSPEEEQVAKGFRPIGPLRGVGIWDEKLAPIGASREYIPPGVDWRNRIRELMDEARLVVLRTGDTPSLLEELKLAVQKALPEKLVLLASTKAEYDAFARVAALDLPKPMPTYVVAKSNWLGSSAPEGATRALIYFSGDWTPHFVPLIARRWRAGKPLVRALIDASRPICEQLNVPWRPSEISWLKISGAAAVVLVFGWGVLIGTSGSSTDQNDFSQAACETAGSDHLGRATVDPALPPQTQSRCCSTFPWLSGC